jgi:hypothetical protein
MRGALLASAGQLFLLSGMAQQVDPVRRFKPEVPKTWEATAVAALQLPLANPRYSPTPISPDYYYKLPVRTIYKSYAVYHPTKQPAGYLGWLEHQDPQTVSLDFSRFRTREEWIQAGEIVFDAPIDYNIAGAVPQFQDPTFYRRVGIPVAADGTVPYVRYVIREKGKVDVGFLSCGMCHTRVMADGTVIKGGQGNFPFDRTGDPDNVPKAVVPQVTPIIRHLNRMLFDVPWLEPPEPSLQFDKMSLEEMMRPALAVPPGVQARHGTGFHSPVQIPDIIGARERRYLDKTGLVRHGGIGDLMRYAALNQTVDLFSKYGDFIPAGDDFRKLPGPGRGPFPVAIGRYSEEQLYALSLYIYSLRAPQNPNLPSALSSRGKAVFEREGCGGCHTPPLYTNNKITPVAGFTVPEDHKEKFDVLPVVVATDPTLALRTRRGTGYYKVPSLKGVWYRGPFEHNGSVMTLEDWFDAARLRDDYVPTGFIGYGRTTRAVPGHEYGLRLPTEDKKALIAFLKTL